MNVELVEARMQERAGDQTSCEVGRANARSRPNWPPVKHDGRIDARENWRTLQIAIIKICPGPVRARISSSWMRWLEHCEHHRDGKRSHYQSQSSDHLPLQLMQYIRHIF